MEGRYYALGVKTLEYPVSTTVGKQNYLEKVFKEWLEDKGVLAAVSGDALGFIGASKAIYKVLASVGETSHENKNGNKERIGIIDYATHTEKIVNKTIGKKEYFQIETIGSNGNGKVNENSGDLPISQKIIRGQRALLEKGATTIVQHGIHVVGKMLPENYQPQATKAFQRAIREAREKEVPLMLTGIHDNFTDPIFSMADEIFSFSLSYFDNNRTKPYFNL